MATEYTKPLPVPGNSELTRPFWEATQRHQLIIPRCLACSNLFFYPREVCPRCLSSDLEWAPVTGKGRVYSFTVVHQPANSAFQEETPYVYAMIELDEGPRMISNVVGCPVQDVTVDMRVAAVFDEVTPGVTLVKFSPA